MGLKNIHLDVLDVSFKIGLYKDEKALYRAYKKLAKKYDFEDDGAVPAGFVFKTPIPQTYDFFIMFSKVHIDTTLIAHECYHLMKGICNSLGVNKLHDHEFAAILTGHLNGVVTEYIQSKGINIAR